AGARTPMMTAGVTRRDFVAAAGGAAMAALIPGPNWGPAAGARRRYPVVGTGIRGSAVWGRGPVERYAGGLGVVGLCDVNPLRAEASRRLLGVSCPTFSKLDEMLDATRPELLAVTTVCATHSQLIVRGLERGIDVLTEKPMTTDETQCQAVLDAEK